MTLKRMVGHYPKEWLVIDRLFGLGEKETRGSSDRFRGSYLLKTQLLSTFWGVTWAVCL